MAQPGGTDEVHPGDPAAAGGAACHTHQRVDRSQDLTVSWSNAITETVRVTLGGERQLPIEVECRFPGSGGTGVVPASLLARLPAGGGFFEILTRTEEQTQAGSWTIEFRAGVYATNAAGATLVGGVELQ